MARVTDDFDGDPRDAVAPDIGADEYAPAGPPPAIHDLVILLYGAGTHHIILQWSEAPSASLYRIYKSTTGWQSGFVLIDSTNSTEYIDNNAVTGNSKSFYYVTGDNR